MIEREQEVLCEYLPHRPPMLLLSRMLHVADVESSAEVDIQADSAFVTDGKGVPAWVGVEYMGQCAALIAGYQQQKGTLEPHTGFLLGTRRYSVQQPWFLVGTRLHIHCAQAAVVGETLANFDCTIVENDKVIATAKLSVFRKALDS